MATPNTGEPFTLPYSYHDFGLIKVASAMKGITDVIIGSIMLLSSLVMMVILIITAVNGDGYDMFYEIFSIDGAVGIIVALYIVMFTMLISYGVLSITGGLHAYRTGSSINYAKATGNGNMMAIGLHSFKGYQKAKVIMAIIFAASILLIVILVIASGNILSGYNDYPYPYYPYY